MKKLYVIGTGSQARYIIENLKQSDEYKIEGLVDIESRENINKKVNEIPIITFIEDFTEKIAPSDGSVIVAYGDKQRKKEIVLLLSERGYDFATVIAKDTYISDHVEVGNGCIINPSTTIMPNTKIGNHVIIHSGVVIEHNNEIGDHSNIAPGVITAGNVKIGRETYVYSSAILAPKIKVGDNCVIGAGAVVLKDVPDNTTVVGIPAKPIKKNE